MKRILLLLLVGMMGCATAPPPPHLLPPSGKVIYAASCLETHIMYAVKMASTGSHGTEITAGGTVVIPTCGDIDLPIPVPRPIPKELQ